MTVAAAAGVNGTVRPLSPGMGVASTVFSCKLSSTPRFLLPAFAACNTWLVDAHPRASAFSACLKLASIGLSSKLSGDARLLPVNLCCWQLLPVRLEERANILHLQDPSAHSERCSLRDSKAGSRCRLLVRSIPGVLHAGLNQKLRGRAHRGSSS